MASHSRNHFNHVSVPLSMFLLMAVYVSAELFSEGSDMRHRTMAGHTLPTKEGSLIRFEFTGL